jgi:hypothetical protein
VCLHCTDWSKIDETTNLCGKQLSDIILRACVSTDEAKDRELLGEGRRVMRTNRNRVLGENHCRGFFIWETQILVLSRRKLQGREAKSRVDDENQ